MKWEAHDARKVHPAGTTMGDHLRDAPSVCALRRDQPSFSSLRGGDRLPVHGARRHAVAEVIQTQYGQSGCAIPASLEAFRDGASVITTGHQLVLAGGPAFFHYKIWTAIRLAGQLGGAIPVFWLASEDHDFQEIATIPGSPSFHLDPSVSLPNQAVGRLVVSEGWRDDLLEWARASNWRADEVEVLGEAYAAGLTLAHAVRRWVHALYGSHGVLVVDGDDAALKDLAAPIFHLELLDQKLTEWIGRSTEKMKSAGYAPPVHLRDCQLFSLTGPEGIRNRVNAADVDFQAPLASYSPNALMRPLYQEFLLQSTAVVGGATECAYWLQLTKAFDELDGVDMPVVWLRDGFTLTSARHDQSLENAGEPPWIPGGDSRGGAEDDLVGRWLNQRLALAIPSENVQRPFEDLRDALVEQVKSVDASLEGAAMATVVKMRAEWKRMEKKLKRTIRMQQTEELSAYLAAWDFLEPKGIAQERTRNFHQMLAHLEPNASASEMLERYLSASSDSEGPIWWKVSWPVRVASTR
ncbi:MAG: bacillithiol biosynthesis protein BshC [Flavobacteriales bacterium]